MIFFIIFLIVFTLPLTVKAALSYYQTERIIRDVDVALKGHFKVNCTKNITIKNFWLKKVNTFVPGGAWFEYGFDYYIGGQWKKYEDRDGNDETFRLSINDKNFCSSNAKYFVYDNTTMKMVPIEQNEIINKYSIKVSIWSDFEKQLLLLYGQIILIIDIIITIIWIMIRYIKIRRG